MFQIIILLLLIVIFPWLLLPFISIIILYLLFVPFSFTIRSLFNILTIPGQIFQIATNPQLRKNHALEHATINVLEEECGPQRLSGYAREEGFYLTGNIEPYLVLNAAKRGLRRLQAGEKQLVIHQRCGTSLAAANLTAALVFFLLLFLTRQLTLMNVILAVFIANISGPTLGRSIQRWLTTSCDLTNMEIIGIELLQPVGKFPFPFTPGHCEYFIRTKDRLVAERARII